MDECMYGKCDIFPREKNPCVEKLLTYESFGMGVCHFCLYMDSNDRIYYQNRELTQKILKTCDDIQRVAMRLDEFNPNAINFAKVYRRYRKKPFQSARINADTRTGFKMGSNYLVKSYFTFGQRVVLPGEAHVIQTTAIPIIFYLRPAICGDPVWNGLFPTKSLHKYDRRILEPFTQYRVPPGCVYVLFCVQKTFFRLDLTDETNKLEGIKYKDALIERVLRLRKLYDEPVKTPYIEDQKLQEEMVATYLCFSYPIPNFVITENTKENTETHPLASPATISINEFLKPSSVEPFSVEQQQQQPFTFEQQQQQQQEQQSSTFEQLQQQLQSPNLEQQVQQLPTFEPEQQLPTFEQPQYILIQNPLPPVRETSIVRVAPEEFVSTYRRLTTKIMTYPKEKFYVDPNWNIQPIDLTVSRTAAATVVIDLEENSDDGHPKEAEPVPMDLAAATTTTEDEPECNSVPPIVFEPEPMDSIELPLTNDATAEDELEWNPASLIAAAAAAEEATAEDELEWNPASLIAAATAAEEVDIDDCLELHRKADELINSI